MPVIDVIEAGWIAKKDRLMDTRTVDAVPRVGEHILSEFVIYRVHDVRHDIANNRVRVAVKRAAQALDA